MVKVNRRRPRGAHVAPLLLVLLVLGAVAALASPLAADRVVYLEPAGEWRFLPGLSEASSPDPTAWRLPDFDDGEWQTGAAPFGWGRNPPYGTDLSQLDPPMRGNYTSLFLRRTFEISSRDDIVEFHAIVTYDDGFLLWINGKEVASDRVPSIDGEFVPFDETATGSHSPSRPVDFVLEDPRSFLVDGTNTIAVQVFNATITSNDLKLDVELVDPVGPDLVPPRLVRVIPVPGSTVRSLTQIEILFDEEVLDLDAADLLVDEQPASEVSGDGAGPYVFSFPEPPAGGVQIAWARDASITDTAPARNVFGGGDWTYLLDPDAPPPTLVITEILAANGNGLLDSDKDTEDWIEIFNQSDEAVDLAGWSLSDDAADPGKWIFPETIIGPREYIVVFASGKDRAVAGEELHTSFKLRDRGEFLGLFNGELPRAPVSRFAPAYPPQRFDYSYGLAPGGGFGYFETPTPGMPNGESNVFPGFAAEPRFSRTRGIYDEPFLLELSTSTPGARIYYTLDGSVPTAESGTLYEEPIEVAGSAGRGIVMVRAVAVAGDLLPSRVETHSFVFPAAVLEQPPRPPGFPPTWPGTAADYAVDPRVVDSDPAAALDGLTSIPTVSIVTDVGNLFDPRTGVYANPSRTGLAWERPVSAELIYPDGRKGFQIDCGIRTQGGSSVNGWKSKKVSLRLLFKGDYGAKKLRFPVFPDYDVDRFDILILDASLNLVWNHPSADQQRQAQYVRDQFVADLQNETGGYGPRGIFVNLYLDGLYWGQYGLHERPDASFAAENFGGSKDEYDAIKHQPGRVVDGSPLAFNQLMNAGRVVRTPEQYAELAGMLDIENFATYMMINLWAGNTDWMHQNWYATRRREPGALWLFHSWDAEHVLKSVVENRLGESRGPAIIFQALRQNPEFRVLFADLVQRHFFDGGVFFVDPESPEWDPENPGANRPASLYMRRIEEIRSSIVMESARWGDVNRPGLPYTRADWQRELDRLLTTYFPRRSQIVLTQFRGAGLYPRTPAPRLEPRGGLVDPGTLLAMSLPEGVEGSIYFTGDGTDPRLPGGAVSEAAAVYGEPIAIDRPVVIRARTRDGDAWSPLVEGAFTLPSASPRSLVISEIMYNPPGGGGLEFIELRNPGTSVVDLSGVSFTNGIAFAFPRGETLDPGAVAVLAADADAFSARYPGVPIRGVYSGSLANGGEKVTLRDGAGETIVSVEYDDEGFWPIAPDGFGRSLVLADADRDPDDPRAWRASAAIGGSPGALDPAPAAGSGGVFISEVLALPGPGEEAAVELWNVSGSAVDVGGWYLSPSRDDESSLAAFAIPAGTVISAGGFLVLPAAELGFELPAAGGSLYLTAVDRSGELTGFIRGADLGASEPGVSLGLWETSTGIDFTAMSEATLGAENAAPAAPVVAINEISYHPAEGGVEFLELFNPGIGRVALAGWRVTGISGDPGGGGFVFPEGTFLPSRGFLVLVPVDPAAFRAEHDVPDDAVVIGPYGGALDNSGERLRLFRPGASGEANVLADMVRYNDRAPWPLAADGAGSTLERVDAGEYGNEVESWAASQEAGGTPGRHNSVSPPLEPIEGGRQVPGDLNQDGRLNITDPVLLLRHLFLASPRVLPCEGGTVSDPGNAALLDASGDRRVDLADAVSMLAYLFLRGPEHALGTGCIEIPGCPDLCAAP